MKNLKHYSLHSVAIGIALIAVVLVTLLFTTTPDQIGPFGITAWFVGLWICISGMFSFVLLGISTLFKLNDKRTRLTSFQQGALLGAWVAILVALNSLGQLGLKDIVLVSILILLIEFYMRRAAKA